MYSSEYIYYKQKIFSDELFAFVTEEANSNDELNFTIVWACHCQRGSRVRRLPTPNLNVAKVIKNDICHYSNDR